MGALALQQRPGLHWCPRWGPCKQCKGAAIGYSREYYRCSAVQRPERLYVGRVEAQCCACCFKASQGVVRKGSEETRANLLPTLHCQGSVLPYSHVWRDSLLKA